MSDKIKITLPDQSIKEADKGSTVYDITGLIGKGLQKAALAARVDDVPVDLSAPIDKDCSLSIITFDSEGGRDIFWHSASHLMAQAIRRIYPGAKLAIGPAIESGFYYDIDIDKTLTPEDLLEIEKVMAQIVEENLPVTREELSRADAVKLFSSMGEIYKVEMLNDLPEGTVSMYRQGEFVDLCRGPHVM
ncbi:MAG TPA: TGS domain-containing protein, partial [Spirochaetota bacterium]|nr:TGS domain-containing protein [Spirochaetota bacterium]